MGNSGKHNIIYIDPNSALCVIRRASKGPACLFNISTSTTTTTNLLKYYFVKGSCCGHRSPELFFLVNRWLFPYAFFLFVIFTGLLFSFYNRSDQEVSA